MQVIALEDAGCKKIHEEIVSGAKSDRPVLDIVLKQLRDGDVLVVWKLDRLGRSLKHLVELVQMLMERQQFPPSASRLNNTQDCNIWLNLKNKNMQNNPSN